MTNLNILLPLYNDWRSCNILIKKINEQLRKKKRFGNILILDDASTQKINVTRSGLKNIRKIKVLKLKKNLGSQKIISIGLDYIKNEKNKIIVIMDSDGEDDVNQINNLIDTANKNKNYIAVASRVKRKEHLIFRTLYKIHLIVTFLLTFNWISFGNYSSFHSSNIKKILKNNSSWLAYSSCVAKNCKIIKISTNRQKRFFGKSKLSFLGLFNHSFRVLSVFQNKILIISIFYLFIINFFLYKKFSIQIIMFSFILIYNFLIFVTSKNNDNFLFFKKNKFIKQILKVK